MYISFLYFEFDCASNSVGCLVIRLLLHLAWLGAGSVHLSDEGVDGGGGVDCGGAGGDGEDDINGVYGGNEGDEEEDIHRRLVCLFSRLLAVPDLRHLEQTR